MTSRVGNDVLNNLSQGLHYHLVCVSKHDCTCDDQNSTFRYDIEVAKISGDEDIGFEKAHINLIVKVRNVNFFWFIIQLDEI